MVALVFTGRTWRGTTIKFDPQQLIGLAKAGLPLTLSLTLASISATVDRFIVAHLSGAAAAGQYSAGVDLVRQTLIIPAISIAATFMPMAVQILANRGPDATREHLRECFELILAITLPAALGFAIVSHHIANVILGPDFRDLATIVMPIVCVAVIFQILTYQYFHIGFLLSDRNSLYLINTASTMIFNCILAYILISAVWADRRGMGPACCRNFRLCRCDHYDAMGLSGPVAVGARYSGSHRRAGDGRRHQDAR